jgi:transposase-like protein
MSEIIPSIFQPIVLRSRVVYTDASQRTLTLKEKTFLANEALGISTLLTWETDTYSVLGRICNRYNIAYSTVKNWRDQVSSGKEINKGGRPPSMNAEAGAKFVASLKARQAANDPVPNDKTLELLHQGVTETKLRQGKRGFSATSGISVNTRKKQCKDHNVVCVEPQILTTLK